MVTGEALLTINISFAEVAGSQIWGPLSLTLRRNCVAGKYAKEKKMSEKTTHKGNNDERGK